MGPSEGFLPRSATKLQEEEEEVAKIMEEGIPPPPSNPTHFFVDAEIEEGAEDVDLSQDPPIVANISTFLRLPQQVNTRTKARFEPMVNYSQSQILTTNEHVQTLEAIAQKKEEVAIEKERRRVEKELTKTMRATKIQKKERS